MNQETGKIEVKKSISNNEKNSGHLNMDDVTWTSKASITNKYGTISAVTISRKFKIEQTMGVEVPVPTTSILKFKLPNNYLEGETSEELKSLEHLHDELIKAISENLEGKADFEVKRKDVEGGTNVFIKISHEDYKVYARNQKDIKKLEKAFEAVKKAFDSVELEFGISKKEKKALKEEYFKNMLYTDFGEEKNKASDPLGM